MKKVSMALCVAFGLAAAGCSDRSPVSSKARASEEKAIGQGLETMNRTQPVPRFSWSQYRQTLIDIVTVQAKGTATTTAFYLEGVGLIAWCPSRGLPIPSTAQLTNPEHPLFKREAAVTVPLAEPSGVYTGSSTGTYSVCLDDNGKAFAHYWEGYTAADSGIIAYPDDKRVRLDGDPSYVFRGAKGDS